MAAEYIRAQRAGSSGRRGSPAEPSCFWEAFGDGCGSELEVDGQRQTDPADEPPEALLPKRRTHPDLGREHIDRMEEPEGEEWQPAPCHSPANAITRIRLNTSRERPTRLPPSGKYT